MDSLTGIIKYKECGKDGVWYPFLPHCFLCIVGLVFPLPLMFSCLLCVWQESCDYSEQRKESADLEYELDAREVGEPAEECGAETAEAEHQSEEDSSDEAYFVGHEVGGINHDGRER